MLLAAMAMAVLPILQTEARDGVFVGTFMASDPASLVVRADNGDELRFLLDPQSDAPAGFIRGTRVAVRFEVLPDGRYRAASVSPPRIPSEPDAVDTLPPRSEPALEPADGRRVEVEPSRARAAPGDSERGPAAPRGLGIASERRAPAAAPLSSPLPSLAGVPPVAKRPIPQPTERTTPGDGSPSPGGIGSGWLAAIAGLLVAGAILAWLARRPV